MMRFAGLVLLALAVLAVPSQADSSNILRLSGGVVGLEQVVPSSGPARWFATIRTSTGDVQVEAATTNAKNVLSQVTGTTPTLLYTGGCFPIQEAVSGGTEELVHVWVCGGTGTGLCKIADGWAEEASVDERLIDGMAGAISPCF